MEDARRRMQEKFDAQAARYAEEQRIVSNNNNNNNNNSNNNNNNNLFIEGISIMAETLTV